MLINSIDFKDAVFLNEFKPSRVNVESKYTEDGREFIFIQRTATAKEPFQFSSDKVTLVQLVQLKTWRDTTAIVSVTLADGRLFNAMVVTVDDKPDIEYEEYIDDDEFYVTIGLKEIK